MTIELVICIQMSGLYIHYSSSTVKDIYAMRQAYCFRGRCQWQVSVYQVSWFIVWVHRIYIRYIYWRGICGIWGYVSSWHIYGNCLVNTDQFLLSSAVTELKRITQMYMSLFLSFSKQVCYTNVNILLNFRWIRVIHHWYKRTKY